MKVRRRFLSSAGGAAYAALAVIFSRAVIKHLSDLFYYISEFLPMEEALASEISDVLSQFSTAKIACVLFAVLGFIFSPFFKKKKTISNILKGFLLVLLFIPLVIVCIAFTFINDILLLDAVKVLVPILGAL